jgi:hypothetical protein
LLRAFLELVPAAALQSTQRLGHASCEKGVCRKSTFSAIIKIRKVMLRPWLISVVSVFRLCVGIERHSVQIEDIAGNLPFLPPFSQGKTLAMMGIGRNCSATSRNCWKT